MPTIIDVGEAETELWDLIDRVDAGEDIVFARAGAPRVRLVSIPRAGSPRVPAGAMRLTYIADDFDALNPKIQAMFEGAH